MKIVLAVLIICSLSFAGVAMKGLNVTGSDKQDIEIKLSDAGVKIDITSKKTDQTIIFKADKFLFWIINNQKKSYVEFTKQDLDNIKQQLAMLQAQMKNMPKAQREMMAQMMGGALPSADVKVELKLKKKGAQSGVWSCNEYNEVTNGSVTSLLCLTPIKALGLTIEDFSSLKQLSSYMEDLAKQNKQAELAQYFSEDILRTKGFPVRVTSKKGDKSEVTWQSIKKEEVAKSTFALPSGLKKEAGL
ncbi:MAG: DUF4412 domain-containing protein [Fibrobacterales bacterium]